MTSTDQSGKSYSREIWENKRHLLLEKEESYEVPEVSYTRKISITLDVHT